MSKLSRQSLLLITIASAGFILSLLAFWPGFMEYDSFEKYGQAIGLYPLEDWHPASMTLLWRALNTICKGPQLMLLLQIFFYWSGFLYLALWLWRNTSKFLLALTAVLVPFLPFLINFAGVIWKDTHLAVALFWATLLLAFGKTSWIKLLISLLLIFYGLSVRHNGIAAVLPLLVLWSYRYFHFTDSNSKYGVSLITSVTLLLCLVGNFGLNRLFSVDKSYSLIEQHLNEIVFIECHSDSEDFSLLERFYGQSLMQMAQQQRRGYLCEKVSSLASSDDTGKIFDQDILYDGSDSRGPTILELWAQSVKSHPLLYLDYRLRVYKTFLRPFSYSGSYYVFVNGMDKNPLPIELSFEVLNPFGFTKLLRDYVTFSATSKCFQLPFRPFFWLITLVGTTLLSFQKKQWQVCLIATSGLLYLILYFPVLPAPDFRYCYYSIFAQILSIFVILNNRYSKLTSLQ